MGITPVIYQYMGYFLAVITVESVQAMRLIRPDGTIVKWKGPKAVPMSDRPGMEIALAVMLGGVMTAIEQDVREALLARLTLSPTIPDNPQPAHNPSPTNIAVPLISVLN